MQTRVGVKVEHNEFTGIEWQPSARMRWTPAKGNTLWASVSRAVRTPSIIEDSARLTSYVSPRALTGGLPLFVSSYGNPNLQAERLVAYELGYRTQITPRLSFDATVFLNDYDRLVTVDLIGAPRLVPNLPSPYLTWNALAGNALLMTPEQRQRLAALVALVPGDFAAVRRQIDVLDLQPHPQIKRLLARLRLNAIGRVSKHLLADDDAVLDVDVPGAGAAARARSGAAISGYR